MPIASMSYFFSVLKYFLSGLCLLPLFCIAVNETAISDSRHKDEINNYLQSVKKLEEKNLNRFSLEVLYQYSKAYDSLFAAETSDTLVGISLQFERDNKSKIVL